jgi:hypothetical protein
MKQVGSRRERTLAMQASGTLIARGARFSESLSALSPTTFMPKGVYHFRTYQGANRHAQDCLTLGMGRLAIARRSWKASAGQPLLRTSNSCSAH